MEMLEIQELQLFSNINIMPSEKKMLIITFLKLFIVKGFSRPSSF